jgi:hypothetical protein
VISTIAVPSLAAARGALEYPYLLPAQAGVLSVRGMEEGHRGRPSSTRHPGEQPYGVQPYNQISYPSAYPQDPQPRQQQQFPTYNPSLEYGISQPANQTYGSMQPFTPTAPRQNAAIEVLSNQFSGGSQYFVQTDSPATVAPTANPPHHQQTAGSHFPNPQYGQYSPIAARLPHPYASSIADLNPPVAPEPVEDGGEYSQHQAAALDEAYSQYQSALKRTFFNMREGRLGEAGTSLLTISDWLLSNAMELATGLLHDDQELHGDRTRLWNEFNTCWLSVLNRQKEILRDYLATGQRPQAPQELLKEEFLERMGREIVRLCDNMERHGLVDYQMGVWEEEIIDAIQDCLDLLDRCGTRPQPKVTNTSAVAAVAAAMDLSHMFKRT